MKKYYLAYGSNLNINQMNLRCPDAKVYGTAELKDHRLLFKGSMTGSYLTVEECIGKTVAIGVWEVSENDEKALDRYEGYPTFYRKEEVQIPVSLINTGKVITKKAFIYIMNDVGNIGIPSRFNMETCIEGYRDFGFRTSALIEAYKYSLEEAYERH